ncbi:MAG: histidine--tRNA ligase [Planctomycetota bacterium]
MKLQGPKGTRDFYPDLQQRRRYLHDAWRRVSVRHGFDEVDGPIYETLDLYKVKSGDGIVSELFSFRRDNGTTDYAIRPEFTPTLARMVAAKANALPRPIKWFALPNMCRAERHQRGRLREFDQWNVDLLGLDTPLADAEVIAVACDLLAELGIKPEMVQCRISHREVVRQILAALGVADDKMQDAFTLLDAKPKMSPEQFVEKAGALGLSAEQVERFNAMCSRSYAVGEVDALRDAAGIADNLDDLRALDDTLKAFGLADWCAYDLGIVRGLAYYTGAVFELHVTTGKERALGGGGRYDKLIELFGGPAMSGVGFGMGDVVLANLLDDENLWPDTLAPTPDAFVLAASDTGADKLPSVVADLRRAGLHTRMSYKATRNLGKLLKDAQKSSARFAVILDDEASQGRAQLKKLDTGKQQAVPLADLIAALRI